MAPWSNCRCGKAHLPGLACDAGIVAKAMTPHEIAPAVAEALDALHIDWSDLHEQIVEQLNQAGIDGAREMLAELGLTGPEGDALWNAVSADVLRYANERGAELVGKRWVDGRLIDNPRPQYAVDANTREMLRGMVGDAVEQGWTAAELQGQLIDNYAFSPQRALVVARTEAAFARNQGALIGAKASGVVKRKVWVPDDDACEDCLACADGGPVGLDEDFEGGVSAPPLHPNCRCSVDYLTEDAGEGDETDEPDE